MRALLLIACTTAAAVLCGCSDHNQKVKAQPAGRWEETPQFAGEQPPTPKTLYAMARILAAQGRDDACSFVLARIIQERPTFLPAYCELAELHLRRSHIEEAIGVVRAGLRVAPHDAILLNDLGMCYMLRHDLDAALAEFSKAAAAAPDDPRFQANVAAVLGLQGRTEESQAAYERILSREDARHNAQVLAQARAQLANTSDEQTSAAGEPSAAPNSPGGGPCQEKKQPNAAEASPLSGSPSSVSF